MSSVLNQYCKNLNLISNTPVIFNESKSLEVEVWDIPAHRWDMEYESIDIQGVVNQRKMFSLLESLRGGRRTFSWELPLHVDPIGLANSNPSILTGISAGSYDIPISLAATSGFLMAGDLVQFDNHSKVYSVAEDVLEETNPTVRLNQPLRKSITASESMITRNVTMTARLDPNEDPVYYNREAGNLDASFTAKFIEAL